MKGTLRIAAVAVAALLIAAQAGAQSVTYKYFYSAPCDQIWVAVKATLSNATAYDVKSTNDSKMNADYKPKHTVHVDVSGLIFQRENHVRLSTKNSGCEMDVVSSYSGFEHDDQGDFKKRVDDQSKVNGVSLSDANQAPQAAPGQAPAAATGQTPVTTPDQTPAPAPDQAPPK